MIEFRSGADIAAPSTHVWPILADVKSWPRWAESFTRITHLDSGPLGVGSRVKIKQPRLPAGDWTITGWEPGRSFSWAIRRTGLAATADHWLEESGEGCVFEQRLRFEGIVGTITARLSRSLIRRYMNIEAVGLKAISESSYHAE